MLNSFHAPQSVLVLGASSDIARACVRALAERGALRRVALAGRPSPGRDAAAAEAADLIGAQGSIETHDFDATDIANHQGLIDAIYADGDIDAVILAVGVLPDRANLSAAEAAQVVTTNVTGCVSALTACAERSVEQGHGTLVVLSSVAGERVRASNFLYGATKAGLDGFATGLGDSLVGSGVSVLVVRPGFVRTGMTRGLPEPPLSVDASDVADAVAAAIGGPSRTVWVPAAMRPVMSVLRHLPRVLFRRLPI
ncbi:MAG: SDR family NAD(P)-dependent oxidoreductase [Nostocoides sp.]